MRVMPRLAIDLFTRVPVAIAISAALVILSAVADTFAVADPWTRLVQGLLLASSLAYIVAVIRFRRSARNGQR